MISLRVERFDASKTSIYHWHNNVVNCSYQTCPNCRSTVRKELSDRYHVCYECGYGVDVKVDRDIASGQEICNRGEETYRGTPEKQEIGSQVVLSGNFVLDKWRNLSSDNRGARSISDNGSPRSIALR